MPNNYKDLSAMELRNMLLSNTLDVDLMDLEEYEKLFGYEIELGEPNDVVLDFCNKGLNQYKEYGTDVQKPPFKSILRKYHAQNSSKKHIVYRIARQAAMIVLVMGIAAALAQGVAMAFGYNLVEMFINVINSPEKTVVTYHESKIVRTDDTRIYTSMNELLETENLKILYPTELPSGYEFTDFRVSDYGTELEIRAYCTEPLIEFVVKIGVNNPVETLCETNGIKYSTFETNGRYQAAFNYNENYYEIVVGDEATLSEIINNLTEV